MLHEKHVRSLQTLPRVNVLTTHSSWLMASLTVGCNGLLSGSGSVVPALQVALWRAVQANDLVKARAINDRIYLLAHAFYAPPFLDMHNRMKEALVLLGRMKRAVVRPPLMKLSEVEIARVRQAIELAGSCLTARLPRKESGPPFAVLLPSCGKRKPSARFARS